MNYDRVILELLNRVSVLEEEITKLKSRFPAPAPAPVTPVPPVSTGKDTTKYTLNDNTYSKNRLALAIVKEYYSKNPGVTIDQLLKDFDKSIQGSLGVVRELDDVRVSYKDPGKRFWCEPSDRFSFDGKEYVVCSQWNVENTKKLIDRAESLGIIVTV